MLDERFRVFGAEFPTATGTAETDLAIEVHFLTTASWTVYVLVFRLDHHICLSLKNRKLRFYIYRRHGARKVAVFLEKKMKLQKKAPVQRVVNPVVRELWKPER